MKKGGGKKVYIALGSNMGDRLSLLRQSVQLIHQRIGDVVSVSSVFESKAQGYESDNTYYNAVLLCLSKEPPEQIMEALLTIETELGRKRTIASYEDRPIDLDFIVFEYFENKLDTPFLTLPHPRVFERDFVMIPLLEIADEELRETVGNYLLHNKIEIYSKQLVKHNFTL